MAIIAYCAAEALPKLVDKQVKQVYCAASKVHNEGMNAGWQNQPVFSYVEMITDPFYDRVDRIAELQKLVDQVKTLGPNDIALFYCEFGQSRSYLVATVVAKILGYQHLTRHYLDEGNLRTFDRYSLDGGISVDALIDAYLALTL